MSQQRNTKMKSMNKILKPLILLMVFYTTDVYAQQSINTPDLKIKFQQSNFSLNETEKEKIEEYLSLCVAKVSKVLTDLPDKVKIEIYLIDRNIDIVGGVVGRTDAHKTEGKIIMEISTVYPGGPVAAAKKTTEAFIFHEFHHLSRGWSIQENEYEPGIAIAAVNEGLAVVFAEEYTGVTHDVNSSPEEVDDWVHEILALPSDADYSTWVSGYHPDGRSFIGYRTGNYLIRSAMEKSDKDILELSELNPEEIIELAGY